MKIKSIQQEVQRINEEIAHYTFSIGILSAKKNKLQKKLVQFESAIVLCAKNKSGRGNSKSPRIGTEVAAVYAILKKSKKPLHINDIMIKLHYDIKNYSKKASLLRTLGKYSSVKRWFKQTDPSTFAIL